MSKVFRVQLLLHFDGIVIASLCSFISLFFFFFFFTCTNKAIKILGTVKEEYIFDQRSIEQGREHFSANKPLNIIV